MSAWCTFRLEGGLYGIDVHRVQEVLGPSTLSPLPLAPRGVRGLVNLRGQIVAAVDPRVLLGLPGRTPERARQLVVSHGTMLVSLMVDAVGDVERLDDDALQPPPDTIDPQRRAQVRGAVPLPGRLLVVLDLDRMLEAAFAA
jgi:purine-binding chemotaxis protein CheW